MTGSGERVRRLVCEEPGRFAFDDVPAPERGAGEVLVETRRVGVCGTDLHAFRGRQPFFEYPRVLGHELSAEVVEVAKDEQRLRVGDQVVVNPYLTCGRCRPCRVGRTNCCASLKVLGVHVDGGLCERMSLPVEQLIPAPNLRPSQMAIVECLGIGAHAVRRSGLQPGQLAVVVGAGPIGVGVVQFARLAGAEVVVIDRDPRRLAHSVEVLSADHGLLSDGSNDEAVLEQLLDLSKGELADVVFDATGSAASMEASFRFVGSGGTYVLVSLVQGSISFDDPEFHRKELSLLSSRNATADDLAAVVSALERGELESERFITHRASFNEVPHVFESWLSPETGVIKAMIEM